MLVKDDFDIDADLLYQKSQENDYWNSAHSFYEDVKEKPTNNLTDRQRNWLIKIEDKLNDD